MCTLSHSHTHTHTHTTQMAILIALAEVVGYLGDYFVIEYPTQDDTRTAYFYALTISLLSIILILEHAMAHYYGYFLGMLTRVLFSSVIYQKVRSSQGVETLPDILTYFHHSCPAPHIHCIQFNFNILDIH